MDRAPKGRAHQTRRCDGQARFWTDRKAVRKKHSIPGRNS